MRIGSEKMKNKNENEKWTKDEIYYELFENYTIFEIVEMYNQNCIKNNNEYIYESVSEIVEELIMKNENITDVIDDITEMIQCSNLDNNYYTFYTCDCNEIKGYDDIKEAIDIDKLLDYLYDQQ